MMVVYYHTCAFSFIELGLSRQGYEGQIMHAFSRVEDLGKSGIVVFFAISGFIIPLSFRSCVRPVANFLVSRFFRLYPAYWLSLILALVAAATYAPRHILVRTILANITLFQTLLHQPDIIGVYWTLFIEWVFYAFCVIAFVTGKLSKPVFSFVSALVSLAISCVMAYVRFETHRKLPVALVLALSIMMWGSLWRGRLLDNDSTCRRLSTWYLWIFFLSVPAISLLAYNFDAGFDETWYRYAIGYTVGMAVFLLFTTRVKLTHPVAVWLGNISYSLYLLHPLVAMLLVKLHHGRVPLHVAHIFTLEVLSLSLIAAHLSYTFIEKPGIRVGVWVREAMKTRWVARPNALDAEW